MVNEQIKNRLTKCWVVGGSYLSRFLCLKWAAELDEPLQIMLGDGTPFFDQVGLEQTLHLKDLPGYKTGMWNCGTK